MVNLCPNSGTSEPGSHNLSDVGMTCPIVTSDPGSLSLSDVGMTCLIVSSDSKDHSENNCSTKDCEKRSPNDFDTSQMNNDIDTKKSEKESCSQTDLYPATSVVSNTYALSRQHRSSKVPQQDSCSWVI